MNALYYVTTKSYPSFRADNVYVKELALAFSRSRQVRTTLVVSTNEDPELEKIAMETKVSGSTDRYRSLHSVFWLNRLFFKHRTSSRFGSSNDMVIFFSNDPYLLIIAGILKVLYGGRFRIASDWHQPFSRKLTSAALRLSDTAIATSYTLKQRLSEFCRDRDSDFISVVYGGVDLLRFKRVHKEQNLRSTLELPKSDFLVGYIGGFRTMGLEKGILTMLDALMLIPDQSIRMIFVGGTDEEVEFYTKEASRRGVINRVIIRGRQGIEDITRYECVSDILVIPYPNEPHFRIAFPMKVYEYMASKRPIIYSNLPLSQEILHDCAYDVSPDDPTALATKIKYLRAHQPEATEMASIARKIVTQYTWRKKASSIIQKIQNTIT